DLLRFGLGELEAADPQPGETGALLVEEERLGDADGLRAATSLAHDALRGVAEATDDEGRNATALVAAARSALEQLGVADPALADLVTRLKEVGYLLADVGADLASYAASIETDPARLGVVQERRGQPTPRGRPHREAA